MNFKKKLSLKANSMPWNLTHVKIDFLGKFLSYKIKF